MLDNCEHLIEACAALADALLRACPELRILATSRQPLGIAGETTFRVPSLSLPTVRPTVAVDRAPRATTGPRTTVCAPAARVRRVRGGPPLRGAGAGASRRRSR